MSRLYLSHLKIPLKDLQGAKALKQIDKYHLSDLQPMVYKLTETAIQ